VGGVYNQNVIIVRFFRTAPQMDERAFEAIFNEHYSRVYAILFRVTGDPDAADDLTAATFWQLWDHPPANDENIAGWLYRVATRLGYNNLRGEKRRKQHEMEALNAHLTGQESEGIDPARAALEREARERVLRVLRKLPLRDMQVLLLRHSGLSYKEIAAALEVSASSVGTLLARAEARFEALYGRGEEQDGKFIGD
jgi:RNA polymerase sigma factor (sigma-70 family)